MKNSFCALALGAVLAVWPGAHARAEAPGDRILKLTNTGKVSIVAVYVAPAGSQDTSPDLLGKQVASSGKTVTIKVQDPKGACVFDLVFLMNDGDMVVRPSINLCQAADYSFNPKADAPTLASGQSPAAAAAAPRPAP